MHEFSAEVLRAYDIRGVFGETLVEADAFALGRTFGTHLRRSGGCSVVVGRDGRLSSPALEAALLDGLVRTGIEVVRIGLAATPMLYFAEATIGTVQAGIQVTGSHNPRDHNGFKLVMGGAPFFGRDIARLGIMAAAGDWDMPAAPGKVEERDILPAYVSRLMQELEGVDAERLSSLRMAWDTGNGAAGPVIERLAALLPGEHHLLHTRVDGRFPNHHPDPTIEANLLDLRQRVRSNGLDLGVAFDGDADRLGVIDASGRILNADRLLIAFARDVLSRKPGGRVVADVKASSSVFDTVHRLGGKAEMAPSGHSHIKARMKATGAVLGGETSGHFFFADDWFGFDDGIYAAIRLIAGLVRDRARASEIHDAAPAVVNTPELRFPVAEERKFPVVEEVRARLAASNAQVNAIDGVRVDTPDGWWLLRASNTQAALTARAEGATEEGLGRLVAVIDEQLRMSGVSRT